MPFAAGLFAIAFVIGLQTAHAGSLPAADSGPDQETNGRRNRPPTANAGGPYSGRVGQPVTFLGTATDPDNDQLTVVWLFGDFRVGFGLTPTHVYNTTGQFTAIMIVADGRGESATASTTVTIGAAPPANRPPSVSARGPYAGTAGQPIAFAGTASDPDGHAITATWNFGDGTPTADGLQVSHAYASAGTYTATLTASDGNGGTASSDAQVTVSAPPSPNRDPVITSSPITVAVEGRPYTYDVNATDPDAGDTLTFALTQPPSGMGIDTATGVIAWIPAALDVPAATVTVRVQDGRGGVATQTFTVVVTPNTPPAISSTPPTAATEAAPFRYDVVAADADGDPLTFRLVPSPAGLAPPAGMTIAATGRIDWTPTASQLGAHVVVVEVLDDRGGRASQTFTVTVSALNRAPRIDSTPVTTAREQLPYSYQVHATDPNSDPIAYALTTAPPGMAVDAVTGLITWLPPVNPPASVRVVVTASDAGALSDTQSFDIAVSRAQSANQLPRITSSPVTTGQATQPYVYAVSAEDADVGDVLTFTLVQPPPGMTITQATGHIAWTPTATQIGLFTVTVRVSDGKDTAQQAYELTIAGQQPANQPPVAHAGGPYTGEAGTVIAFSGAASSDPDGDPLTFSWNFGDGGAVGTGLTPSHTFNAEGSFVVTLTVTDGRGGESARSTTASVGAAGDRSPPSVTLVGPREVLPGDRVTFTAQALDNVGIRTVTFDVDGADPTETSTPPFQRTVAVPSVASPGTQIRLKATAADPSGNAGSAEATLTITARLDTVQPTIVLNAPPIAAPGTTMHLSAGADDNAGIQSVSFSVNGAPIAQVTEPPYEARYAIPADTPIGSTLAVGAAALDFSANRGEAAATVSLVQTADAQPPTVLLTAPTTVVPGATLALTASAADNRGISAVDFYVDGVQIGSDPQTPYSASFTVPTGSQTGRSLQLEARAIDFAGLEATDSRQVLIVSSSSLAQGVIAGEVYDDTTGLPVEGAAIALTGNDTSGQPYTQTATSDRRGRYLLRAVEGSGVLQIARADSTRVDREVDVAGNQSLEVFDARVTPIAPAVGAISPVLGGTLTGPPGSQVSLIIPAGGLTSAAALALTPIGQQGLQGLLPAGWSPVAAADVTPHTVSFAAPATLSLPRGGVPANVPLVLVRWDEAATVWRAVVLGDSGDSGPLTAAVDEGGQYAWLLGDALPVAPPAPAVRAALSGVVAGAVPLDAVTSVLPQSTIVFYQPGVRTGVTGAVASTSPVSSGSILTTRISESYRFTSGVEAHLDPYVEDLVLYQAGGGPSTLSARYTVTPSIAFEPVALASGVITVELFEPSPGPRLSQVITESGGSATAITGERADVPAGALTTPAAVVVRGLAASDLGFDLPPALTFVGGLTMTASGAQFTGPVTLSIPKPAQFPVDSQILIARIAEVGTSSRLVLVAVGRVNGDRIESSIALGGDPDAFDGPRDEGRYLFIRPASPVGFARGFVHAVGGDPFAGALVSADTLPLFAISRAAGEYVAAASIGAVSLLAQDLTRNDTGTAQGTIVAADSVLPIDLRLGAVAPHVLTIAPADQAENVPLSTPIVVTFSEPLNPASVTSSSVLLAGPDGTPVAGTLSLSGNNSVITLRPATPLPADTAFTVTVSASLADLSGYVLGQAVTARFSSLDVTAPPPPPAGTIAASIPGADGTTTVTATQGTAGPRDTVSIINETRGTTTPVLLDPSGGFSAVVAAGLADRLRLRIVDAAGNVTVIDLPLFSRTNGDGSVSAAVGAPGGVIAGPGGVSASVKPGTFPDGAIVTIKPVAAGEFPVQLTPEQQQVFGYAGGVQLDFGGQVPTQYVNVAVPAGAGDRPDNQWVVGLVTQLNGQNVLHVVDTAKLIDGKVTTSSPPCPGVTAAGLYGIFKSSEQLGLTFADTSATVGSMLAQVDVPFIASPFLLPFLFLSPVHVPQPMCIPVLSGRVTIVPNTVTITIPRPQLSGSVGSVVVKNLGRGTEFRFGRSSIEFPVTVKGNISDLIEVFGTSAGESSSLPFKKVPSLLTDSVDIVLGIEALIQLPSEIVVRNRTNPERDPDNPAIPGDALQMKVSVTGGFSDRYSVVVEHQSIAGCCPVSFQVTPSPDGGGSLVARAVDGTIDPTQAEIDEFNSRNPDNPVTGPARTKVEIVSRSPQADAEVAAVEVPAAEITQGGFTFAFDGDTALRLSVRVSYADGSTNSIDIPVFRITVSDPDTGEVIKTIVLPSPPADRPLDLGRLTDDHLPPAIISSPLLPSFDPSSDLLTITFSEPLDKDSVDQAFVIDQSGNRVGTFRLSNGQTSITFVPDGALTLGATYTVVLDSITDLGGNGLPAFSRTQLLQTVAPRLVGSLDTTPSPAGIRDIRVRTKNVGGVPSVFLVATTDSKLGNSLITINATDPARPSQVVADTPTAGFFKRYMTLLPDVSGLAVAGPNPCPRSAPTFSGDLAVTTSWTVDFSYVSFFDVTDPKPCLMSNKLLTASPDSELFSVTRQGTYHLSALTARGVATIPHLQGIASYSAMAEAGLFAVDIGPSIPEKPGSQRQTEAMLPGNYFDVAAYRSRLLALNRGAQQLEIIDPTLAVLGRMPLPDPPRRLVLSEQFPIDANRDGIIGNGESVDVVFIAAEQKILMVDLSNLQAPRILGVISMPATILELDVNRQRRQLVALDSQNSMYIVDLATPATTPFVDVNADGIDDRIVLTRLLKNTPHTVRWDTGRPFLYVGTALGLEVYAFGTPTLSGTAKYTFYPVEDSGLSYPAPGTPASLREIKGAIVELRSGAGELLQTTTTDDAGFYSFDAPRDLELQVIVKAALGRPNDIHVDVIDNTKDNAVYFVASEKFSLSAGSSLRQTVTAETIFVPPSTPGDLGNYEKRDGAPFAILDAIYAAEQRVRLVEPGIRFPRLHVGWSKDNRDSLDPGGNKNFAAGFIGTAHFNNGLHTLFLRGLENDNTDEYDRFVILHEWSHYFEFEVIGRLDGFGFPTGTHANGDKLDLRLAFIEGFANAHAAMLMGDSRLVDTSGPNQASSALGHEVETDSRGDSGFFAEDAIHELLWDLFDGKSETSERDAEEVATIPVGIADDVHLDYPPIYRALRASRNTRAFTSIFSFMHALLADPNLTETDKANIKKLAAAENIDLTHADEYEGSPQFLYTVVPVNGTMVRLHAGGDFAGSQLQTRTADDPRGEGNKRYEHVFFKFTVTDEGVYEFLVNPIDNMVLTLLINDGGNATLRRSFALGGPVQGFIPLAAGDYTASVMGFRDAGDSTVLPGNARFEIRFTPVQTK